MAEPTIIQDYVGHTYHYTHPTSGRLIKLCITPDMVGKPLNAVLDEADRELARKSPDIDDAVALGVYSGKSLPNELVYRKAAVDALLLKRGIIERPIPGPAVAELKDPYFTTCVICNKPWGAGELHAMHSVTFHGRLVTNLFVCCDCNAKIRRGEI